MAVGCLQFDDDEEDGAEILLPLAVHLEERLKVSQSVS